MDEIQGTTVSDLMAREIPGVKSHDGPAPRTASVSGKALLEPTKAELLPVAHAIQRLDGAIGVLQNHMQRLEDQFAPVMTPPESWSGDDDEAREVDTEGWCETALAILTFAERVEYAGQRAYNMFLRAQV